MTDSEAILTARAAAGDSGAFAELADCHRQRLMRSIALMIGDVDEAESLTQEALTRAFAQLADYRPELPFGAWVHGIALNLCRNHLRNRVRRARPAAPDQLSAVAAPEGQRQGVLSEILRREVNDLALTAIASLPLPLREAFVLHFMEGMDYAAMSRITQQAAGTLRVRAHRARTLLRGSLGSIVDTWMRDAEGA